MGNNDKERVIRREHRHELSVFWEDGFSWKSFQGFPESRCRWQ
jgi:hypothetical protein